MKRKDEEKHAGMEPRSGKMQRIKEKSDQDGQESELTSKLALDPIPLKNEEYVVLPKNIKEEIKNNVAELKELLKDDSEFCISLIKSIVNVGKYMLPQGIDYMVFDHYDDIIKQCTKEYKSWPIQVTQVRSIASSLAYLVSGYNKLIFDALKDCEPYDMQKKCEDLGELCRIEIGVQFNPKVDYHYELDPEYSRMYDVYVAGQCEEEDL
jgi:hypothetical protein